ncbi:MAG: hypothetical protein F4Y14_09860 [Acidobacteria bacterium]|nr:hypothetical protein [Acidobacteriota bacterium]
MTTINPKLLHTVLVLWLIVPTALAMITGNDAWLLAIVPLLAIVAVRDHLRPKLLHYAAAAALAVASAAHVGAVSTDLPDEVADNTAAIEALDETATAADSTRQAFADGEDLPIAGPCDLVLASLDQLRYIGGLPAVAGGAERLHIIDTLVSAILECANPDDTPTEATQ